MLFQLQAMGELTSTPGENIVSCCVDSVHKHGLLCVVCPAACPLKIGIETWSIQLEEEEEPFFCVSQRRRVSWDASRCSIAPTYTRCG